MVGLREGAVSYARGTPVLRHSLGEGACMALVLVIIDIIICLFDNNIVLLSSSNLT